jgi:hypothetical protein
MALTIAAASAAAPLQASAVLLPKPPPPAQVAVVPPVAQSSSAAASGSKAQQQAALNQMLVKYTRDQAEGADGRTLSALSKQIMTAARALGQNVMPPHPPVNSNAGSATSMAGVGPTMARINLTA